MGTSTEVLTFFFLHLFLLLLLVDVCLIAFARCVKLIIVDDALARISFQLLLSNEAYWAYAAAAAKTHGHCRNLTPKSNRIISCSTTLFATFSCIQPDSFFSSHFLIPISLTHSSCLDNSFPMILIFSRLVIYFRKHMSNAQRSPGIRICTHCKSTCLRVNISWCTSDGTMRGVLYRYVV